MRKLNDWVKAYEVFMQDSEPPKHFLRWAAYSAVAAALQRKVHIQFGYQQLYANMYVLLTSPPGVARKNTAINPIIDMLREIRIALAPNATTRAQLVRILKECMSASVIKAPEEIDDVFNLHSSLTIFVPEMAVFLMGYGASQMISDLCDWYDAGSQWSYEKRGADEAKSVREIIPNVWVNIHGATTPELIRVTMPKETTGSGLSSRIIYVCSRGRHANTIQTFCYSPEGLKLYKLMVNDLRKINELKGVFVWENRAWEFYSDWYLTLPKVPPAHLDQKSFQGYWSRRQTHLIKLAMVVSASRRDDLIITLVDIQDALKELELVEQKMPIAFSQVGSVSGADMLEYVASTIKESKEISVGTLLGVYFKDLTEAGLTGILKALKGKGRITITTRGGEFYAKHIGG